MTQSRHSLRGESSFWAIIWIIMAALFWVPQSMREFMDLPDHNQDFSFQLSSESFEGGQIYQAQINKLEKQSPGNKVGGIIV